MICTIENKMLTAAVNTAGAELWDLRQSARPEAPLLWDGKKEVWPRRTPILFPWCGPLEGGWHEAGGKRYKAPQHGFMRDVEHTLAERGEDFALLRYDWPGDGEKYPWAFSFTTRHELKGNEAVTTCTAVNTGSAPMPAQLGFHPGLRCPFTPGKSLADYFIRFQRPEAPGGTDIFPLDGHSFENDSICFPGLKSEWIQLEERDTGRFLRVETKGWPFTLLWSKPGVPGFVCIEPWTGYQMAHGHDLAARPGAVLLRPGESLTGVQRITVGL